MEGNKTGSGVKDPVTYESLLQQNIDECPFFVKLHEWFGKNPGIHVKSFSSGTGKNLAALARKVIPGGKRASSRPSATPQSASKTAIQGAQDLNRSTPFFPPPTMSNNYRQYTALGSAPSDFNYQPQSSQLPPLLHMHPGTSTQMQPPPPPHMHPYPLASYTHNQPPAHPSGTYGQMPQAEYSTSAISLPSSVQSSASSLHQQPSGAVSSSSLVRTKKT